MAVGLIFLGPLTDFYKDREEELIKTRHFDFVFTKDKRYTMSDRFVPKIQIGSKRQQTRARHFISVCYPPINVRRKVSPSLSKSRL